MASCYEGLILLVNSALSLVVPPVLLLVALGSCGVGHGDCRAAVLIAFLSLRYVAGLSSWREQRRPDRLRRNRSVPGLHPVLATVRKEGLFRLVVAGLSAAHVIAATFAVAEFL